jgi:hypothetical protein
LQEALLLLVWQPLVLQPLVSQQLVSQQRAKLFSLQELSEVQLEWSSIIFDINI